ncbi:MAG: DUF4389 domain-containing protein [Alphaproteobacteria bacterium]|nr:DUF4389 domain-containing protein [Alphaproteobacteria bacterium]
MAEETSGPTAGPSKDEKTYLVPGTWLRGLFMVLFAIAWSVAEVVLLAVAVFQFGFALFTGEANARLRGFGDQLAQYICEIARFVTYNTDEKPWPFNPWPQVAGRTPATRPAE